MEKALGNKIYYTISEVAELADLKPYTLRAWEKEFACLRPRRMGGKNRAYRNKDIGIVLLIKRLIYGERFTTQGVVKKLKEHPELIQQAEAEFVHALKHGERPVQQSNQQEPHPAPSEGVDHVQISHVAAPTAAWLETTKEELRAILALLK